MEELVPCRTCGKPVSPELWGQRFGDRCPHCGSVNPAAHEENLQWATLQEDERRKEGNDEEEKTARKERENKNLTRLVVASLAIALLFVSFLFAISESDGPANRSESSRAECTALLERGASLEKEVEALGDAAVAECATGIGPKCRAKTQAAVSKMDSLDDLLGQELEACEAFASQLDLPFTVPNAESRRTLATERRRLAAVVGQPARDTAESTVESGNSTAKRGRGARLTGTCETQRTGLLADLGKLSPAVAQAMTSGADRRVCSQIRNACASIRSRMGPYYRDCPTLVAQWRELMGADLRSYTEETCGGLDMACRQSGY